VIGDSITVQAIEALEAVLANRWYTLVWAKAGSMFRTLQHAAERIGASQPQVVVINLGTNDQSCALRNASSADSPCTYADFTVQTYFDDARTMVGSLPGACIIGTTTWFGIIGDLWSDMLATGEIAGVVPWREYLLSLSAEQRQPLLRDGLGHLTAAGTVALAQMTAEVVDQACGASS
jgi:lysophospholipase L1-like esterase